MKKHHNNILKAILLSGAALAAVSTVQAAFPVTASDVRLDRAGDFMSVDMMLGLEGLDVPANRAVLVTPALVNGADTLRLPAVGVYGRTRYYYYQRNNGTDMISGPGEQYFKASEAPASVEYHQMVPYADWMDGADLTLLCNDYGCCRKVLASSQEPIGHYIGPWFPQLVYVTPAASNDKIFTIEGSAFIEFPVNETVIYPDFRSNPAELGRIVAGIDSVRSDKDVTISQLWLKGYASPEGKWDYNANLARKRTASLKSYVNNLYNFPAGIIETAYEPEDWAGLRKFVESSNLEHRDQILAEIDSSREPDAKEWRIKSTWPEEYAFLLQNVYPSLRHTDYRIAYNVRHYSDINEIRQVLATRPQNLDLNELYLLAGEYEPGSDGFTEVYETAVRMFPDDPVANLNAVNAALVRGDVAAAERYAERAGNSAEAVYARGALEIARKDYSKALQYFRQAEKMGLPQAAATIAETERRMGYLAK